MNEIDDKTRAQVLREERDQFTEGEVGFNVLTHLIDQYDPPRPQIEPGPVRFRPSGVLDWMTGLLTRSTGSTIVDTTGDVWNPEECEIISLRTLGPTQVAVDVPNPREWSKHAKYLSIRRIYSANDGGIMDWEPVHGITLDEARRMWEEHDGSQQPRLRGHAPGALRGDDPRTAGGTGARRAGKANTRLPRLRLARVHQGGRG